MLITRFTVLLLGIFLSAIGAGAFPSFVLDHEDEIASLMRRDCHEENHQPDNETLASYAASGLCYSYFEGYRNHEKSVQPCKPWCATQNNSVGYGCSYNPINETEAARIGILYCDDDGKPWTPSTCSCDYELALEIFDLVAQALHDLPKIICAVCLQAFEDIQEIGLMAIPGGEELEGAMALVKSAKTWYENGLDAASFFTSWVGDACDMPDWNFDLDSMFISLVSGADSLGTSKGCFKKVGKCVSPPKVPDPPKPKPKEKGGAGEGTTRPDLPRPPSACRKTSKRTSGACKSVVDKLEDLDYGWERDSTDGTWDLYWNGQFINNVEADAKSAGNLLVHDAKNKKGDRNPKKVALRDILTSFWKKSGKQTSELEYITYTHAVEEDLEKLLPRVYSALGRDMKDDKKGAKSVFINSASSGAEQEAYKLLVNKTPFGAGARKMLDEYSDFAGRTLKGFNLVWNKGGGLNFEVHFPK